MSAERTAGAVLGSLVAGLALTALLVAAERRNGQPNEIATLERTGLRRLGLEAPRDDALPDAREQATVQGAHLALSAAAGLAYAALTDEDAPIVTSGVAFGLGLYAALQWLAGPILGLKVPEWRSDRQTVAMHTVNHILFGLVTAAFARGASRLR